MILVIHYHLIMNTLETSVTYVTSVDLVNHEGDKAVGVLTVTGLAVDGEEIVIGGTTYEVDTNSSFTVGNVPVVVAPTHTIEEFTTALATALLKDPSVTVVVSGDDKEVVTVTARLGGTCGNAIATTTDITNASWADVTLTGGTDTETENTVLIGVTGEGVFIPTSVKIYTDNCSMTGETDASVTLGSNSTSYDDIVADVELTGQTAGDIQSLTVKDVAITANKSLYSVVTCPDASVYTVTYIITGFYL